MIVLDTNVISELLRPAAAPPVLAWFANHEGSSLFVTALTAAELLSGAETMPPGRKRTFLQTSIEEILEVVYAGRILPFDESAARAYAAIVAAHKRAGRPISTLDAAIAAIAKTHRAALATRNTADFAHCGIRLIDPWTGR
jgi:toxin FitB